jgi:hypothetical protein
LVAAGQAGRFEQMGAVAGFSELEDGERLSKVARDTGVETRHRNGSQLRVLPGAGLERGLPSPINREVQDHRPQLQPRGP